MPLSHSPGWKVTGGSVESRGVQQVGFGAGAAAQRSWGRGSFPRGRGLLWVRLTDVPTQRGVAGAAWCIWADGEDRLG